MGAMAQISPAAGLLWAGTHLPGPGFHLPSPLPGWRPADFWLGGLSHSGEKSVQLVMEYVPLGSLRDYLPRHSVGLAQLLLFALQICEVGRPQPCFWNLLPSALRLALLLN